jgi:hypothetical protein
MTPVIEDARRRQRRRRRFGTFAALGIALIAGAIFGVRQFGPGNHVTASTNAEPSPTASASFSYETEQGASGLTIRRVVVTTAGERRYGPRTLIPAAELRRIHATAVATLDPATGAIEVRVVDRNGLPTMITK